MIIRTLLIITTVVLVNARTANGQTCSSPEVKFIETFGTGTPPQALPAGRTNYSYKGSGSLSDGDYKLDNSTQGRPEWHDAPDHTGNTNGRMMIVNASYTPGEFYRDTVEGLVPIQNYSVSLYAMNVNKAGNCGSLILPRLQMVIESYNADGSFTQLASLISNDIPYNASPTWLKIEGLFDLPAGVTAVRYRIINNATGGCGNDLAIDDITFSQCAQVMLALPESDRNTAYTRPASYTPRYSGSGMTAFPNPFQHSFSVEFSAEQNASGLIRLFDVSGKMRKMISVNLKKGTNAITADNLAHLPAGLYFLDVADNRGVVLHRSRLLKK